MEPLADVPLELGGVRVPPPQLSAVDAERAEKGRRVLEREFLDALRKDCLRNADDESPEIREDALQKLRTAFHDIDAFWHTAQQNSKYDAFGCLWRCLGTSSESDERPERLTGGIASELVSGRTTFLRSELDELLDVSLRKDVVYFVDVGVHETDDEALSLIHI